MKQPEVQSIIQTLQAGQTVSITFSPSAASYMCYLVAFSNPGTTMHWVTINEMHRFELQCVSDSQRWENVSRRVTMVIMPPLVTDPISQNTFVQRLGRLDLIEKVEIKAAQPAQK